MKNLFYEDGRVVLAMRCGEEHGNVPGASIIQ